MITIGKSTPTLSITSPSNVVSSLTVSVITSATYGRGGALSYAILAGSGSATVNSNGLITAISAGTATLIVNSTGDVSYYGASTSQSITIGKATPILTITSANTLNVDGALAATATTTAVAGQGGAITFAIIAGSGSATVNAITGLVSAISVGTVTLTASSAGDSNYNGVTASQLITIGKSTPNLTITSSNILGVDGVLSATVNTTATRGRGGAITFAIVGGSGSATVNATSGLVAGINAGTVTLVASSVGDVNYNVGSTSQLITIVKTTPTLVITSSNAFTGTMTATVNSTATGGRGGAITFAIAGGSGSATINSSTGYITAVSAGTVTLSASSTGDSNYNGTTTSQLLIIGKSGQVLSVTSASTMIVDGSLTASVSSTAIGGGGTLSFSITKIGHGSVLINSSTGLMKAMQSGTVILVVTSSGNSNYASATVTQTITVFKTTPTLTITSSNTMVVGGMLTASVNTTATYGRGGAITFAIIAGSGSATVNPSTGAIRAISAGTITLIATSAGDSDYNSAMTSQVITINNNSMTTVSVPPAVKSGDPVLQLNDTISVPEVYSPNGDGIDDSFDIQNITNYPNNELVIADRKGEAVFKAHGYDNQTVIFTGKSSTGDELVEGIYYYYLTYYDNGKLNKRVGYFKLKR